MEALLFLMSGELMMLVEIVSIGQTRGVFLVWHKLTAENDIFCMRHLGVFVAQELEKL